ncbi:MAG: choice-of-anchor L domain-containing protein, partial [Bacteroidetes bacterium]|nr:choice-of-anchor L domain-containing protein [Bacteroidota bacterium]
MRSAAQHSNLRRVLLGMALCALLPLHAQLVLNQSQAPTTLVQNVLMGPGVFCTNVTFNGSPGNTVAPSGGVSTLGEIGRFNGSNTCLGLNAGVFLCTGNASYILPGPNDQLMQYTGGLGGAGFYIDPDIDLSHLSAWPNWQVSGGNNIGNKSILEFDFVPTSDMISVRYVFSSEEYERWACSQYNDVFGFFISGPGIPQLYDIPFTNNALNMAFIPGSMSRVSINTVNSGLMDASNANGPWTDPFAPCFAADPNWQANAIYYRYNGGQWPYPQPGGGAPQLEAPYNTDPYYIQANGMTVVLTASAAVECGQMYHIKLGVGNVADNWFPSAVWLEQNSFTSSNRFKLTVDPGPNVEYNATDTTFIENDCDSVYLRFHRLGGFYLDEWLQISTGGTASNGVDVQPALIDSVHFNQLDSFAIVPIKVPVDADGLENLIVNIITCNGTHVQTYEFPIDQRPPLVVTLEDTTLTCPAEVTLAPTVTGGGNDPAEYTYLWNTGETTP